MIDFQGPSPKYKQTLYYDKKIDGVISIKYYKRLICTG